jgi:hypothetical protein
LTPLTENGKVYGIEEKQVCYVAGLRVQADRRKHKNTGFIACFFATETAARSAGKPGTFFPTPPPSTALASFHLIPPPILSNITSKRKSFKQGVEATKTVDNRIVQG